MAAAALIAVSGCDEADNPTHVFLAPAVYGIPLSSQAWFYSSSPLQSDLQPLTAEDRGQLLWFNPQKTVSLEDLDPTEEDPRRRQYEVPVLEVIFVPGGAASPSQSWGALVTSAKPADVTEARFLDIWVNDYIPITRAEERRGELLIDIGRVNEDAVWDPQTPPTPQDSILDLEDHNLNAGQAEADEDRGLDYKWSGRDPQEPPRRPGSKTFSPFSPTQDPAGDDRAPNPDEATPENTITQRIEKYEGVNGTEGNQHLDTEDLDGNYELDLDNHYFEYRIDLSAPADFDAGRDGSTADPRNGWRYYRVPLATPTLTAGFPDLSGLRSVRIWFTGIATGDTLDLQIAYPRLVDVEAVIPKY